MNNTSLTNTITSHFAEWFFGPKCINPKVLKERESDADLNAWYNNLFEEIAKEKADGKWGHLSANPAPPIVEAPIAKPRVVLGLLGLLSLPVVFIILGIILHR